MPLIPHSLPLLYTPTTEINMPNTWNVTNLIIGALNQNLDLSLENVLVHLDNPEFEIRDYPAVNIIVQMISFFVKVRLLLILAYIFMNNAYPSTHQPLHYTLSFRTHWNFQSNLSLENGNILVLSSHSLSH